MSSQKSPIVYDAFGSAAAAGQGHLQTSGLLNHLVSAKEKRRG
jgi:hypothetical protein